MGDFEQLRAELAAAAAEHLLTRGLGESGLRALARAVGTSDRVLLHCFRDAGDLLREALGVAALREMEALSEAGPEGARLGEEEPPARLGAALGDERWGAPQRLWVEVAARGDEPWRSAAGPLMGATVAWIEGRLREEDRARRPRVLAILDAAAILEAAGRADLAQRALGQAEK